MDESSANETIPDLKDLEVKIGRKTPEGLLRWMRDEASSLRGDKLTVLPDVSKTGRKSLDEKIKKLKMEMENLRSVDVKILQQLLAVHEGIEAVKWLMEERSTLTSRCSSLTSSQYSLGEGPDTSWRGSWSSLQDPTNDKLDNISIGSYLDTLADDMDEYCPSSSESVICSTTPLVSEATAGCHTGVHVASMAVTGTEHGLGVRSSGIGSMSVTNDSGKGGIGGAANAVNAAVCGPVMNGTETTKAAVSTSSPKIKSESPKRDSQVWTRPADTKKGSPIFKNKTQMQAIKANGFVDKTTIQKGSPIRTGLSGKPTASQSPKQKPYKNGKVDMDSCKMNGKMHLEYDAHWHWVQSQEDVTFL